MNAGLANVVNKIQLTINQHWQEFHERRTTELQRAGEERRQDNKTLVFNSFLMLGGFLVVLGALLIIGFWIRRKCSKIIKSKKHRSQLIEKRLKAKKLYVGIPHREFFVIQISMLLYYLNTN